MLLELERRVEELVHDVRRRLEKRVLLQGPHREAPRLLEARLLAEQVAQGPPRLRPRRVTFRRSPQVRLGQRDELAGRGVPRRRGLPQLEPGRTPQLQRPGVFRVDGEHAVRVTDGLAELVLREMSGQLRGIARPRTGEPAAMQRRRGPTRIQRLGAGEERVRALQPAACGSRVAVPEVADVLADLFGPPHQRPGLDARRLAPLPSRPELDPEPPPQTLGYRVRHRIPQREQLTQRLLEAVARELDARRGIHQLHAHPHPLARPGYAALDVRSHAELANENVHRDATLADRLHRVA